MRKLFRLLTLSKATKERALFALFAIAISAIALETGFDYLLSGDSFKEYHAQFDTLLVGAIFFGVTGYVFGIRKYFDLKREQGRRNLAETKAEWISYHDILTRLPNRRFLEDRAPVLIDEAFGDTGYAAFAIDLDGFKKVNEAIGPDGGDRLLIEISHRLSDTLPHSVVIRLGSDEFLVIAECPENCANENSSNSQQSFRMAEDIIHCLNLPIEIKEAQVSVGASIGFASCPKHSLSLNEVVKHAIISLSVAKRQGRNSFVEFEPEMDDDLALRARVERQLRTAVSERQIVPHYQPLVDLRTGEIIGFEALARWRTPYDGFISPDLFIRIAENAGLMMELSECLLYQACNDATTWPKQAHLAFNISPRMLEDRYLGMLIFKILGDTGLSPQRLEIEITESALVRDTNLAASMIKDLRNAGVRVALDDFGTGYSSLAQLSKLTFDKIKIDRIFVAGLETDEKKSKIVRTMIALASGLGISTTAEGIEQDSQLEYLKELGCTFGQGYLFGKAVPAEQAAALLTAEGEVGVDQRSHAKVS